MLVRVEPVIRKRQCVAVDVDVGLLLLVQLTKCGGHARHEGKALQLLFARQLD